MERKTERKKDRQTVWSWTETFGCFFRATILICPEDMRMFRSTFGKRDRQKDK